MKVKQQSGTVNFDPEKVTENVTIDFTKIMREKGGVLVTGNIRKGADDDWEEIGYLRFEDGTKKLNIDLTTDGLDDAEVKTLCEKIPVCVAECMNA
jgi:uncharacterized protein YdeI (BOF family)